jgi:hypothetical protein
MEGRELQSGNPSMKFPLQGVLTRALDYLRVLLSSKDPAHRLSLCQKLVDPQGPDDSIAPRCRTIMGQDWGSIPD